MQTAFEQIGVPGEIQIIIFVIAIALIAASFFPGVDFGPIRIPHFSEISRKTSFLIGLLLFSAAAAARYPAFYIPESSVIPPAFTAQSQCSGSWIFNERGICEDKSQPIPLIVTDGEICGWEVSYITVHPTGHKTCQHVSHGVASFANSENVNRQSGWRGGGSSQPEQCQIMKNNYTAANPGRDIVWTEEKSSERSRKRWDGHVQYNYNCSAVANWNPIYNNQSSEACGRLDPVQEESRLPKQCEHPTNVADYHKTQNVNCEWNKYYSVTPAITESIFNKYTESIAERPICITCSEFSANAEQMAGCLINNFERIHALEFSEGSIRERLEEQIFNHLKLLNTSKRPIAPQTREKMTIIISNTQK